MKAQTGMPVEIVPSYELLKNKGLLKQPVF